MGIKSGISRVDEDAQEGRILSDEELSLAIKSRNDIFFIDNARRLYAIEAVTFIIGIIAGIWLNSIPVDKAAPDFYRNMLKERAAKLLREPIVASVITPKPPHKERTSGRQAVTFGQRTGRYTANSVARGDRIPMAGMFAHGEPPPRDSIMNRDIARTLPPGRASENWDAEDSVLVNRANILKKQENRAQAFAMFRQVLSHNPHDTGALTGMGDAFMYSGWLDSAEAFYKSALAANPRIAAAHNGLGNAQYYLSTMAANPNFVAMHNISNSRQLMDALYDSAIADYTVAISLDSSYVQALTNRGVLRDLRKDHEGAIKDYTLAIRINPACAEAFSKRASTLAALGKLRDAIADYTAAIHLDTTGYEFDPRLHFANAYYGRGIARYKMGDLNEAIADFDSALALSPKHSLALLGKAIALEDTKRYEEALSGFNQAIALLSPLEFNGAKKLAFIHRGNVFRALGAYDTALADYLRALDSLNPSGRTCWHIAQCHCLKHENDTAIVWLKKSIACGFKDFNLWKRDRDLSALRDKPEFLAITRSSEK